MSRVSSLHTPWQDIRRVCQPTVDDIIRQANIALDEAVGQGIDVSGIAIVLGTELKRCWISQARRHCQGRCLPAEFRGTSEQSAEECRIRFAFADEQALRRCFQELNDGNVDIAKVWDYMWRGRPGFRLEGGHRLLYRAGGAWRHGGADEERQNGAGAGDTANESLAWMLLPAGGLVAFMIWTAGPWAAGAGAGAAVPTSVKTAAVVPALLPVLLAEDKSSEVSVLNAPTATELSAADDFLSFLPVTVLLESRPASSRVTTCHSQASFQH